MRYVFCCALMPFVSQAFAGDTLTRAQVYDFSVGDTFEYANTITNYTYGGSLVGEDIYYYIYVISGISWAPDSSVKYIARQYLPGGTNDTIVLINPFSFEIFDDSSEVQVACEAGDVLPPLIDSSPLFLGHRTNSWPGDDFAPMNFIWCDSLGPVLSMYSYAGGGQIEIDSTFLVYCSGPNGVFGTFYTNQPAAIEDVKGKPGIHMFPTINSGVFTAQLHDNLAAPVTFVLYNVAGKKVEELILNNAKNYLNLQSLADGMYIWQAHSTENFYQTGKIIITHSQ